jgi:hypothetical protein
MKVMMHSPPMIRVAAWMRPLLDLPSDLSWSSVLVFLVASQLRSRIRLREVKVFDEVVPRAGGTGGLCPYGCLLKSLEAVPALSFRPGALLSVKIISMTSKCQKMAVFIDISLLTCYFRILCRQA